MYEIPIKFNADYVELPSTKLPEVEAPSGELLFNFHAPRDCIYLATDLKYNGLSALSLICADTPSGLTRFTAACEPPS